MELKDFYIKCYKAAMKETEENTHTQEDNPCSWIGGINIITMAIPPKVTYRFSAIFIKIPMAFNTELKKKILTFTCNHRRPQIANVILNKKNKAEGITLSDFKIYCKNMVTKKAWYCHKNRQIQQ